MQLGCDALINGPAPLTRPGPDTGGISSSASLTLLSPEALAFAALVRQAQRALVKDKAYRATPVGAEVGRFLRALKWADSPQNTLDTYEIVLARLAYDHAHYKELERVHHRGAAGLPRRPLGRGGADHQAQPAGDRQVVLPLGGRGARPGGEPGRPDQTPPKKASVDRQAYAPDLLEKLRRAQPTLARPDLRAAARPARRSARTSCGCCRSVTSTSARARSSCTARAARSR